MADGLAASLIWPTGNPGGGPAAMLAAADLEFAQSHAAAWLLLATAGAVAAFGLARWRERARHRLAASPLIESIAPGLGRSRPLARAALATLAAFALAIALLDPRGGASRETVEQRSIDIMVIVDVSRSMLAEDASPNRLARAKQFALDLVEGVGSDRVGLIEFAGVPALRCPLTFNHRTFAVQLESLSPQATVRGGSMLGDAIRLAGECLADSGTGKAIIILSDGEDMESEPVEAAAVAAREHGIATVAVGIGDPREGARIPLDTRGERRYIVHEGQEVWTRMNPTLLTQVAEAGNGFFVEAATSQVDMAEVAQALSARLERSTRTRSEVSTRQPLFQALAGLALLCLLGESLMAPRRPASARPRKESTRP